LAHVWGGRLNNLLVYIVSPLAETTWIGSDGKLYPVDAGGIMKMSDAVIAHVDTCFDAYATLDAQIKSGAVTTLQQIEDAYAGIA
jgi:hypothetical protein